MKLHSKKSFVKNHDFNHEILIDELEEDKEPGQCAADLEKPHNAVGLFLLVPGIIMSGDKISRYQHEGNDSEPPKK